MPKCDFNKVTCNFTDITLRYGCSSGNQRHISRIPFFKNTSGGLLLAILEALYGFKEKRARKTRNSHFFFQNAQNEIFEILKMFKTR